MQKKAFNQLGETILDPSVEQIESLIDTLKYPTNTVVELQTDKCRIRAVGAKARLIVEHIEKNDRRLSFRTQPTGSDFIKPVNWSHGFFEVIDGEVLYAKLAKEIFRAYLLDKRDSIPYTLSPVGRDLERPDFMDFAEKRNELLKQNQTESIKLAVSQTTNLFKTLGYTDADLTQCVSKIENGETEAHWDFLDRKGRIIWVDWRDSPDSIAEAFEGRIPQAREIIESQILKRGIDQAHEICMELAQRTKSQRKTGILITIESDTLPFLLGDGSEIAQLRKQLKI